MPTAPPARRLLASATVNIPLMLIGAALLAGAAAAPDARAGLALDTGSLRRAEIASCEPGELRLWDDGRDAAMAAPALRLVYRHAGAPAAFDEATVLGTLQRAAQAWSACGIPALVLGEAAAALDDQRSVAVVVWNAAETRGNFALADTGRRRLALSAPMFALLLARRNPAQPVVQTLRMALSHELGHFYGLMAHSSRCIDVMSYYTSASGGRCSTRDGRPHSAAGPGVDYRAALPTACDLARCRALNGATAARTEQPPLPATPSPKPSATRPAKASP